MSKFVRREQEVYDGVRFTWENMADLVELFVDHDAKWTPVMKDGEQCIKVNLYCGYEELFMRPGDVAIVNSEDELIITKSDELIEVS